RTAEKNGFADICSSLTSIKKDEPMKEAKSRLSEQALSELREGGDAFYRDMLTILVETLREGIAGLHQSFNNHNWEKMGEIAHGMRGPCSHLGIESLWHLLKDLEEKGEVRP